jgi:hypothetical protein
MKKVTLIVLLVLVSTVAFAEYSDGWDWTTMYEADRIMYVVGFFEAMQIAQQQMMHYGADPEQTNVWFYIPYTVGEVVDFLDAYYADRDFRKFSIPYVIYLMNDNNFWDEEPVEPYNPASDS